ncbi:MAG: hypothetical protein IPH62_00835 [Ignavibacteriae bacterium]|nr:hypothetical protein [Ignavibacteriota bacterium]
MKLIYIIILISHLIIFPNENYCQKNNLSYDNMIYYLDHYNIRHFPDSLWWSIIEKSFLEIKKGDTLVFNKLLKLSSEERYNLFQYISVDWAELITHYTNLVIMLSRDLKYEEIKVVAQFAFSSKIISELESKTIINKIELFLSNKDQKIVKTAENYLRIIHEIENEKYLQY